MIIILKQKINMDKASDHQSTNERHKWTKPDDIVTLYLYKFGDNGLPYSIEKTSKILGIKLSSLKMRIGNFKAADGKPGLNNFAKLTGRVYEEFNGWNEENLRRLVLEILEKKLEAR